MEIFNAASYSTMYVLDKAIKVKAFQLTVIRRSLRSKLSIYRSGRNKVIKPPGLTSELRSGIARDHIFDKSSDTCLLEDLDQSHLSSVQPLS
jgi:hypothetical protein